MALDLIGITYASSVRKLEKESTVDAIGIDSSYAGSVAIVEIGRKELRR